VVNCGRSSDLAIVDPKDVVRGCERKAVGRGRTRLGQDVVVSPKGRGAEFGLPRTRRMVPLLDGIALPVATSFDTREGSVRLTAARTRRRNQTAAFSAGLFTVLQARSRRPITEVRLKGGDFGSCRAGAGAASGARGRSAGRRVIRRLRGSGRGRFRTRGRHSAATVRGTDYTVEDRCDGTLTTVRRGVVAVRDFRRRRTVIVRAGGSYLAKAPQR
jgi:nitrous oxidase accessory protein NosD